MVVVWRLKTCRKCQGDLLWDGDEWHCLQCGRYYYPNPAVLDLPEEPMDADSLSTGEAGGRSPSQQQGAPNSINSLISALERSDRLWWERNKEVIQFLDEGYTVWKIAALVARSKRQIQRVKDRLRDERPEET